MEIDMTDRFEFIADAFAGADALVADPTPSDLAGQSGANLPAIGDGDGSDISEAGAGGLEVVVAATTTEGEPAAPSKLIAQESRDADGAKLESHTLDIAIISGNSLNPSAEGEGMDEFVFLPAEDQTIQDGAVIFTTDTVEPGLIESGDSGRNLGGAGHETLIDNRSNDVVLNEIEPIFDSVFDAA